jgi:hypothetical protein
VNLQSVTPAEAPVHSTSNVSSASNSHISRKDSHVENIHPVNPDIKVHSVVSADLDYDHDTAMTIPLGEVSDEQLLAEVARRHIDLHDKITDSLVKETYEIGKVLGHGASGKVYQVTHKVTGQVFACKVVKKNSSMNDAQSMSTEIEIMKRIRHRNIVSMYELYETPKCLWIILELVDGGDLHHYLAQTVHYNEVMASKQFKQILMGCHYLHSLGVVHRDLKLDNILLHVSHSRTLSHSTCITRNNDIVPPLCAGFRSHRGPEAGGFRSVRAGAHRRGRLRRGREQQAQELPQAQGCKYAPVVKTCRVLPAVRCDR